MLGGLFMDNITKINDIKYLIMEFYSDQEPLTEEQQKSKECFFRYCDEIRAELKAFDALSKDDEKAKKELSKEIEKTKISPKNLPAIQVASNAQIGALAPQEKQVINLIVLFFSLSSSNVLVAIIAGTLQPKPVNIGMKALPDKPNFLNALSKIKATRAI